MCGIAGWIDYERDLTAEVRVIEAMTATMRSRGPDDNGLFVTPRALLGHQRLAVIDPAGGRQPMIEEETVENPVAMSYSGEIFNYRELRAELTAHGHRFHTRSDTEVVLRAYLEWGERCPEHFVGIFAVAVWDGRDESLYFLRDHSGIKPLYYTRTRSGIIFGSEPKAVLANPAVRARIGMDGMRELLAFTRTPGHAFYEDLAEVPPGTTMRVNRAGVRSRTYWRLTAEEHEDDLDTTIETTRGMLVDIVDHQLIADVPLCGLLSGGLDSTSVMAMAMTRERATARGPMRSFTLDFEGYVEGFRPDPVRDTPDSPYAAEAAEYLGLTHSTITLDSVALADPALRRETVRARDLPVGANDQDASLYLLFRAIRAQCTVALSGGGGDELFGGYAWFHDQRIAEADTFPWHAMTASRGRTGAADSLLSPALRARLDVPAYQRQRYREAIAEVPTLPGEGRRDARMRELSYLALTRCLQFHTDREDRIGMANGLEVRVPLCDHRLIQYVFNVPWSMKSFDGREKSLLRAAVANLLPRSLLLRRKAHYPAPQDPEYGKLLCYQLAELLANASSPVIPLLDIAAARKAAVEPEVASVDPARREALENALTLNCWLDEYPVELTLDM